MIFTIAFQGGFTVVLLVRPHLGVFGSHGAVDVFLRGFRVAAPPDVRVRRFDLWRLSWIYAGPEPVTVVKYDVAESGRVRPVLRRSHRSPRKD